MAKIAFMTIGLLHEPYDSLRVKGFIDRIDAVFDVADTSEGFMRRCPHVECEAQLAWGQWTIPTVFQSEATPNRVASTLSLWHDLESVFAFAYNGLHAEALS